MQEEEKKQNKRLRNSQQMKNTCAII